MRLATDLMLVTRGRIVAKSGAEGLLLVAVPDHARGIAIKCEDGAMRAKAPPEVTRFLWGELNQKVLQPRADWWPELQYQAGEQIGWHWRELARETAGRDS